MLEKAKSHIIKAIESGILVTEEGCEYYPCHFKGQDCTWCYCPFYPCLDEKTDGKYIKSKTTGKDVWSCIDCQWIHKKEVAGKVMMKLKTIDDWTNVSTNKRGMLEILGD